MFQVVPFQDIFSIPGDFLAFSVWRRKTSPPWQKPLFQESDSASDQVQTSSEILGWSLGQLRQQIQTLVETFVEELDGKTFHNFTCAVHQLLEGAACPS